MNTWAELRQAQAEPLGQGSGTAGMAPDVSTTHTREAASLDSENHYPSVF